MESFGGTRIDGYFIIKGGLILLCVKWSYFPHFFIKPRTPLSILLIWGQRRNPIGLLALAVGHLACCAEHVNLKRPRTPVAYLLFFSVGIEILVLVLLSWNVRLPRDLWCFSLNLQTKRAYWIYYMIRLIYIHPVSTDIKNELHKKIIFSNNSRPCSAMIIFSTHTF